MLVTKEGSASGRDHHQANFERTQQRYDQGAAPAQNAGGLQIAASLQERVLRPLNHYTAYLTAMKPTPLLAFSQAFFSFCSSSSVHLTLS